ncbi:TPA: hypothetical protein H1005_01790 [archaeon]|nr:hypothetical protein [Candidatus Naiadarchaeales archaeon SRR2090153.bin1042]
MPVDIVNTTVTGGLISGNIFLQSTMSKVLVVMFVFIIATLILFVLWNRLRQR